MSGDRGGDRPRGGATVRLSVPGMDCPSCAGKVETALWRVSGVVEVDTRPATGRLVVQYDPERTGTDAVRAAVEGVGYEVEDDETEDHEAPGVWRSRRALKTGIGAVFLLIGLAVEFPLAAENATLAALGGWEFTLAWAAYLVAAVIAGGPVVRNGYYSARNRHLDIDLLMAFGIASALLVDLPFEAATLATLFSVAELLERFSMDRARDSIRSLMELSPAVATVRRDGVETVVPAEEVAVGETVVVRPGEKVPLDGVVRQGTGAVDESPITGESVPVEKSPGDEVFAGTLNGEGYLEVETTATADDSTLSRVIALVEEAERDRTEIERFVDRFARYYTPSIVVLAVLTVALSPVAFGVGWKEAFVRGLTLLVIACPCAFVISTPVSVVSGITAAARNGVLIKGGTHLEAMGEVGAVAFDKTGTLTTGELGVTDVLPLEGSTEEDVLRCARAIEGRSEHPVAQAIVAHADDRGVAAPEVTGFEAIPGRGVKADLDGVPHYAGSPGLFADLGFDLGHVHVQADGGWLESVQECDHGRYLDLAAETIPVLQSAGKTVVLVGRVEDGELVLEGAIGVADTVRPEARHVVERLHELGIERVVMLTGDNERTARVIADAIGVDEVRAGLLPEEKVEVVEALVRRHGGVAMVGDGVNDAPALAAATVGIAMGAAGTDAAIETADAALMADDLTRLPYLYALSRRAGRVIRQNIAASLGVKAVLAVGAPLGLVSVIVAIVVGDMGMSLGVTGNAMRLAGIDPDR